MGHMDILFVCAIGSSDPEGQPDSRQNPDIAGSLGPGDLILDRVGPDPFDPSGLGSIVTVRWPVRIGDVAGAVRLWLPESMVSLGSRATRRSGETIAAPRRETPIRRPSYFAVSHAARLASSGAPMRDW